MLLISSGNIYTQNTPVKYLLEGPYNQYAGPYRIATAIHFENHSSWSDTELDEAAIDIFDVLNQEFNQYNIYFYSVQGTSACEVGWDKESLPSALNESRLDLDFYYRVVSDPVVGQAYGLPYSQLFVEGDPVEEAASNLANLAPVLIHEVGHCLGLYHIFTDDNLTCIEDPSSSCTYSASSNICDCCGDHVCDTPDNEYGENVTLDASCNNPSPSNALPAVYKNYMSYATPSYCRDHFTQGQAERMWAMLAVAPDVQGMQRQNSENAHTGTLAAGTYWNIVVESGNTLQINSPIEMMPGAYIRVEKNATLRVSSTITGACDNMWRGIIVEGSSGQPQTTTNQGKVIVQSSGKIEHAQIGVDLLGLAPSVGGGILTATIGSTFENNVIGVRFGSYQKEANKSRLWASEFYVTDDFRANAVQPVMIRAEGVEQLVLLSPTFKDLRTQCVDAINQAVGVELYNASARFLSGTFEDLSTGIYANQIDQENGSFSIGTATFTNCLQSIHTNITSSFAIQNNTFEIAKPRYCPSSADNDNIGVAIFGETTGFTFRENDFYYNGITIPLERTIGTRVNNTGEGLGNTLEANSYDELFEGILATLENDGNDDGMLFLCNTFTELLGNSNEDAISIHIEDGASVKVDQGKIDPQSISNLLPAGNIFSIEAFTFYNNPNNSTINYYYNNNAAAEDPDFTTQGASNLVEIAINAAGCATDPPCDNPPCPEPCTVPPCGQTLVGDWTSNFYSTKDDWQTRVANLPI
ncbi:MAG: M43 family zinc metalloprotease [Saprospiraceae bacterium]